MISSLAVLSTALLFGGMTLYSFGLAAFLFKALPAKTAGAALRRAFPWLYTFVIATSAAAALLWWPRDAVFAAVMAAVAVTTVPVRQILMPDKLMPHVHHLRLENLMEHAALQLQGATGGRSLVTFGETP